VAGVEKFCKKKRPAPYPEHHAITASVHFTKLYYLALLNDPQKSSNLTPEVRLYENQIYAFGEIIVS
jgi:hypothetical protein